MEHLKSAEGAVEMKTIVSDSSSEDNTPGIAAKAGAIVLKSSVKGRAGAV